jgi:aerobic carbon-monoxide dehydrogenase large subunit
MIGTNRYIGSPVERIEDLRFLRGRGEFVGDLRRDGMLHAAILRSPIAHGRLRVLDATAARATAGVRAVITAEEIGALPTIPLRLLPLPGTERFLQPVIAADRVRYVGEPIAVVLADSAALAEDALEAIRVEIDPLPAVVDWRDSAMDTVLLFEDTGSNLVSKAVAVRGDAGNAFRNAAYTRRERFRVQRHTAVPMEPRGLLAQWNRELGKLTVCGAAKLPFFSRQVLAKMMGLGEDLIAMVENDVGGGFGVRGEFYPEDFLIPFSARHVGRPVKWIEDRREHFLTTNHARETDCDLEIACARDGTILGLRGDFYVNSGAYVRPSGLAPAHNEVQFLSGPYRVPHIHLSGSTLLTNKTPSGTYRAPGRFETSFFCERLLDLAAQDLGIDRVEIRRRNLVSVAEMPYPLAQFVTKAADAHPECCDSGDYGAALDRCLQEFNWTDKVRLQGKLIDGRYHGIGIGCFIEGGAGGLKENARLVLERDGRVSVFVGSSALGQGLETVFSQIVADALELPLDRILGVFHGSTHFVNEGFGSWHSRAVVMGGSALLSAAANLKEAIRRVAAASFGCKSSEVEFVDGRPTSPAGASLDLAGLAAEGVSAEGSFFSDRHTYTYGTHAAHVAVDPRTGRVEIIDYMAVEDAGRIINPRTLHGQVIGGIVQGLGGVFLEEMVYDKDGQLLTGTFADYLLPTANDFPNIRSIELEAWPSPTNPLGAKGAGEGGIIPVGGVIANAVSSALSSLGVELRELPLTPSRLWQLIGERRQA